jgi:hypothetical protein
LKTAKSTWGQPAEWCDYSGTVDGQRVGIVLMADAASHSVCASARRFTKDSLRMWPRYTEPFSWKMNPPPTDRGNRG